MPRKYLIETYGCQMNVHDSERMAGLLEQAGYEPTDDAADADVVVINTCSVREHAEDKLYTRLGELRVLAQEQGHNPIVAVAGCVAQQEGESLLKRSPGVADVIVGTQAIRRLPMLVERAAGDAAAGHRPRSLRGCHVPAWRHPPRRSGQGVRHDHRGLQRVLQLLRRAVHARQRADAAEGRHPRGSARSRRAAAAAKFSSWARSSTTTRRPTIRRATSRRSSRRFTPLRASTASGSPVRIRGTFPRVSSKRCSGCQRSAVTCTCRCNPARRACSRRCDDATRARATSNSSTTHPRRASRRGAVDGHDRGLSRARPTPTSKTRCRSRASARFNSMFSFKYSPRPNTLADKRMADDVPEEEKTRRIVRAPGAAAVHPDWNCTRRWSGQRVDVLIDAASRKRETELSGRTSQNTVVNLPGPPAMDRAHGARAHRAGGSAQRLGTGELDTRARRPTLQSTGTEPHADRNDHQGIDGRSHHEHADRHSARPGGSARPADLGRHLRSERDRAADRERHDAADR